MSNPIIQVEHLGKSYLIGHNQRERYTALRDTIGREAKAIMRNAVDLVRGRQIVQGDHVEEFWALQDISLDVQPGDVVGIIGRNGAGKSTLLKVLSRITEPTRGRVILRGRVSSLLEVGTGFHPELTGRENIYLNGAILGMSRAETARKFEEIVAFAEIEKFLDTPVKRYSSGMYVRLAFAVAAHLEPEILIVDEVLAVGDAEFQKKCLGKMGEVASHGRTVIFVSHNLAAVRTLCSRSILLDKGRVIVDGEIETAFDHYLSGDRPRPAQTSNLQNAPRSGTGIVRISSFTIQGSDQSGMRVCVGETVTFSFRLAAQDPIFMRYGTVWFLFKNRYGDNILMIMQKDSDLRFAAGLEQDVECRLKILLAPGSYSISIGIVASAEVIDWLDDVRDIVVENFILGVGNFDGRLGMITGEGAWTCGSHASA